MTLTARPAEAERVVNEAAQGKAAVQEEAWPGETTDAGGVELKIETVKPAVEGRFDWKQAGMTEKNTWTLAKALTQCMI